MFHLSCEWSEEIVLLYKKLKAMCSLALFRQPKGVTRSVPQLVHFAAAMWRSEFNSLPQHLQTNPMCYLEKTWYGTTEERQDHRNLFSGQCHISLSLPSGLFVLFWSSFLQIRSSHCWVRLTLCSSRLLKSNLRNAGAFLHDQEKTNLVCESQSTIENKFGLVAQS